MRPTVRTTDIVLVGLGASAMMLALAPLLMPDDYSWLSKTTSESAAQGVEGAWLGRSGFAVFGLSVLLLTGVRRRVWGVAAAFHGAFGVFMFAAAMFSTRSWDPAAGYNRAEDVLHSVAATAMGFAFAGGVVAMLLRARFTKQRRPWSLDAAAILASFLLPLAMSALPDLDGALQRVMFAVAYTWFAAEAIRTRPAVPR